MQLSHPSLGIPPVLKEKSFRILKLNLIKIIEVSSKTFFGALVLKTKLKHVSHIRSDKYSGFREQ